jgi:hypothetical protein
MWIWKRNSIFSPLYPKSPKYLKMIEEIVMERKRRKKEEEKVTRRG